MVLKFLKFNMEENNLSIIIPTYKREKQIIQILDSLNNQISDNVFLEVNICDSYSNYDIHNFQNFKKNINIRYFNIKDNILSSKRNFGILKASYKKIILLDDDCIPSPNFIKLYLEDFSNITEDVILSGIVYYPKDYIKKNNHIKFKQSRHFISKDIVKNKQLQADKIVAMNMGFINSKKIQNIGLFNENFIGYGFEDYEFGYRCLSNGFKLQQSYASIIHDEGYPNINSYIKKYYYLGLSGMENLILINFQAAKKTIFYEIESNLLFKLVVKIYKIKNILSLMEKIISKLDKFDKLYIPFVFNLLRLAAYTRGCIDRNIRTTTLKKNNWYE
jgi:glycosyltransferase involved in cell wall biosynthesis